MSYGVRLAAKAVVSIDRNRYVFVAGQRGMFNLPGGGVETIGTRTESYQEALDRELQQEIGIGLSALSGLVQVGPVKGLTTPADGTTRPTRWMVFRGQLEQPFDTLAIPAESEITAIAGLTLSECIEYPNMSELARQAVVLASV
jgi:8-oxo-dGTP pyrophosphatase MutT (NUDIX family)